jgi:hypothetical protein
MLPSAAVISGWINACNDRKRAAVPAAAKPPRGRIIAHLQAE